jgi:hypothetical protein
LDGARTAPLRPELGWAPTTLSKFEDEDGDAAVRLLPVPVVLAPSAACPVEDGHGGAFQFWGWRKRLASIQRVRTPKIHHILHNMNCFTAQHTSKLFTNNNNNHTGQKMNQNHSNDERKKSVWPHHIVHHAREGAHPVRDGLVKIIRVKVIGFYYYF